MSDIHGNATALRAVLDDVERQGGVDAFWVLGDLVALGPDPVPVLELLAALPNLHATRGNTDRYVTTAARPAPTIAEVIGDPSLTKRFAEVAATFAWTQGAITAAGWFDWLDALPLEQRLTLPDGTRLLGVHAAPGTDEGDGVHDDLDDEALGAMLNGCGAYLVVVGHTHRPLERTTGGIRVVNLGSVSMHATADKRASYALLQADNEVVWLTRRRVSYDRDRVLERLERSRHPGRDFIARYLRDDPTG